MPFIEALNHYVAKIRAHPLVHSGEFDAIFAEFENSPCIVDLGCGNGHFLQDYLAKHPEFSGLGIEKRYKRVFKTAEKLNAHEAKVVQGEIADFLDASPTEFWDEIWLQFPDPWPKLRHAKHRIVRREIFDGIERTLKVGGKFLFRSDCRVYWEDLQRLNLQTQAFYTVKAYQGDLFADEPKTLFQKKFEAKQIPIYSLEFQK